MDIALARTFLVVAEAGSFVEAAGRLHVTQSTISARMKALEETIGKPLLTRAKSGVRLTAAGQQFHRHALALVRVWEHARLEVGLAQAHRDHLAVGGQVSLWDGFLLHWVGHLRAAIPDIAVTAVSGSSHALMDRLIEGTLDLAIMYRPAVRPGLMIEHLFDEELVLVTSGEAKGARSLADYVFVNWGPEFATDHAVAFPELSPAGLSLDLGALGVDYLVGRRASGYFPMRVARALIGRGELRLVARAPRFVYPAYAVYPVDRDEDAYQPILESLEKFAAAL